MELGVALLNIELPELSDEELAFLEGGGRGERLVELETLDGLDAGEWEIAESAGLRSLLDRRLLSTADEPEQPLRLRAELETIMATRSLPTLVVLVERLRGVRRSGYTIYGAEPGVVLVETIVEPGRHAFSLCASALAAVLLAEFADPNEAAGVVGGEAFETRDAIEAAIGTVDVLTRIFAVRRVDDDRPDEWEATLAASASGLWTVVESRDGRVTGWPVSADELADLLERLLDPDC